MRDTVLKKISAWLCLAAVLLTLGGCGSKEEGAVALREGEAFTLAVTKTPDSFNPVISTGGLAEEFFLLCYDPLWRINAAGEAEPCLVEDWSLSSDSLTWTIRLKKDIVFSDGTPMTAADVVFSYGMMKSYSALYREYFKGIEDIRCPDDYTVVISTEYVKGDLMYNPTPILPQAIWKNYEFSPADFDNAAMVGTGPFVYDAAASGEELWVFRAREDYTMGAAMVGSVEFAFYKTETGASRALSSGEVDASYGLTDVQLTTLEGVPGVELIEAMLPQGDCWAVAFNTESEFFSQLVMRQMVEYAANRERILMLANGGAGELGSSFAAPGADYFAAINGLRDYDANSALWTLQTNGYMDSDNDGILDTMDKQEPLRLTMYTSNQDIWAATAATVLSGDLTELGVDVRWKRSDDTIEKACADREKWDMCLVSWRGSRDPVVAAMRFASAMEGLTGWTSGAYQQILEELCTAEEATAVAAVAARLQQTAYERNAPALCWRTARMCRAPEATVGPDMRISCPPPTAFLELGAMTPIWP